MKTLVVFDFDYTVVDDNSDTWVIRSTPDQSLPDCLKQSYQRGRWTEYMGRVLTYIGDQSVHPDHMRTVMETIPFTKGMIEVLTFISENKKDIDCIIVSDSNTLFIDWILHVSGVKSAIDDVFSNPASIDARGYMSVRCFHAHDCQQCPINLCKRKVLNDFRENQDKAGVQYQRICYVGDGGNDFCPIKDLKEGDIAMPRKGFTLEKLLCKARSEGSTTFRAKIVPWDSGNVILQEIRALIE
ncbi:pyridoxal phosphate phosphatase PHOSPHO2 [Xyrauchen texanus]|uniref:pyridoxal phosphate phosphatase PHOSPHO2 n=1 Tax=Xyrauchen texanus TaxID=154827 RepID=UPI002242B22E|nr:pyridoxal phosphate phosphatase PHOSPHO2 [Xyrauchen texanus]XP_051986907.1 pyridoxal phosphate phosphatase PHOSPHO2 [Xyrauchen texanus]